MNVNAGDPPVNLDVHEGAVPAEVAKEFVAKVRADRRQQPPRPCGPPGSAAAPAVVVVAPAPAAGTC